MSIEENVEVQNSLLAVQVVQKCLLGIDIFIKKARFYALLALLLKKCTSLAASNSKLKTNIQLVAPCS